jgi:ADP-ribose pyrophosphatase YjhB (NUDIX family)
MKRFNIRVYGICINTQNEILLSDEVYDNKSFTKFPGGGLEFGEGVKDCLKREFHEEFQLQIEVGELFYLTDFFQLSAFSDEDQVISIYYNIQIPAEQLDRVIGLNNGREKLHWIPMHHFGSDLLTFPIDKIVASKLVNEKQSY